MHCLAVFTVIEGIAVVERAIWNPHAGSCKVRGVARKLGESREATWTFKSEKGVNSSELHMHVQCQKFHQEFFMTVM